MSHRAATLAETESCPLCGSALRSDYRARIVDRWLVTRSYDCGCSLGGMVGNDMTIEEECSPDLHKKTVSR